jgi:hypothetical protein
MDEAGLGDIEIDYDFLTRQALRRVVQEVLLITEQLGAAPGDHHFYIEFETQAAGVSIPEYLLADYPERMTIVLQHQFDDLSVGEDDFSVTLWFNKQQARLTIPFDAVMSFADPSVQFGLRFGAPVKTPETAKPEEAPPPASSGAVLQLDAFRKK